MTTIKVLFFTLICCSSCFSQEFGCTDSESIPRIKKMWATFDKVKDSMTIEQSWTWNSYQPVRTLDEVDPKKL